MRAADYGHDVTVEILAEAGADMKLRDKAGRGTFHTLVLYWPELLKLPNIR